MKASIFLWFVLLLPRFCLAQPVDLEFDDSKNQQDVHERAQKKDAYKLRVRYVKVEGRWAGGVQLPLAAGDTLTPEKLSEAMKALQAAITNNTIQGYGLRSKGEVGVLYIDVDFDTSPPASTDSDSAKDTVGVTFHPYYLDVALVEIGNNVLPIPRSPLPTFFENVPKPLLALNPTFGLSQDRAFGAALGGSFAVDLFNLSDPARVSASTDENRHLDVRGQGMKSVDQPFYRLNSGLRYSARQTGTILQEFSLGADYNGVKEPLGDDQHTGHAGTGSVGVMLKLAPNTRLSLDTGYRWTEDKLDAKVPGQSMFTVANEWTNRLLFQAIPRSTEGFLRAALWEDNGWLTKEGNSYQRLAGRLGYAKEIPVMRTKPSVSNYSPAAARYGTPLRRTLISSAAMHLGSFSTIAHPQQHS